MTVICWDGQTLAVDGMAVTNETVSYMNKMWCLENEGTGILSFVVGCGLSSTVSALIHWYSEGEDPDKFPYADDGKEAQMVILHDDGTVHEYDNSPVPMECPKSPLVWGCGGDIALGAMSQGADAIEAVKAACIHNAACGGDISWVTADSDEVQVLSNTTVNSWGEL